MDFDGIGLTAKPFVEGLWAMSALGYSSCSWLDAAVSMGIVKDR